MTDPVSEWRPARRWPPAETPDFADAFNRFGDGWIVVLGEAKHADQFDAYGWFEETRAVNPLGTELPYGASKTKPFGL